MSARVSAASESNANPRLRGCGEDKHVYVILPAYNEQDRIAEVLCALKSHQCRVIVVDDGSTDATFEAAAVHGATVIRHAVNRGQGAALQTGFDFALSLGAKVLVTMDADGQHCAEDLRALVEPILSGKFQVALGSRFLDDRTTLPCSRRWLLKLAVQFTRWTTGLNLSDTHNGYRALAQCAAAELQLTEDRMAHATEILHLVRAKHWSYCEIPVRVVYDEETLAKGQRNWEVLRILWQLLASRLFPILQPSNDGRIDTGLSSSLQSSKAASPGRTTSGLANRPYSFN